MKVSLGLPPGVVRGATPSATPGRWFDTNLVRWRGGRLMPVGGWERITQYPLPSIPRAITTWVDLKDVRRHAVGCDGHLIIMAGDTDTPFDATPVGFKMADSGVSKGGFGSWKYGADTYGTPRENGALALARGHTFTISPWGQDILSVASFDGRLYHWSPSAPTTKAKPVPNAPKGIRAAIVTDERHVVVIGGDGTPRQVSWCSREDYNDWDFASVTNTAGFLPLNSDGIPVAMCRVREGTLIFTEMDVWLLRFIGAPYVYSLDRIGETTSLISPNSIAAFGGRAVWMGREGFFLYDGGFVKPLLSDVGGFIFEDMDPISGVYRTHAGVSGAFAEVWFYYPSKGSEECDRYAIWNFEENWWALGKLSRTVTVPAGVAKVPMAAGPDRHIYQHESGWSDAGTPRLGLVSATGSTVRMGAGDRQMSVTQLMPDLGGVPKAASFTFAVRDTPDAAPRIAGPYLARADGYMDARFTGRDAQLTVAATADEPWTLGAPIMEVKQRGKR